MTNDVVEPSDHELTREERNHLKAWILDCDEEGQSYDSELLKKLFRATLTSTQGQAAPSAENKDAISEQHSDLADELDVERLADLMQEEPFSGDQHVEGTTDHRQRLEHYASLALRSNRAADADEITALRARVKELEGVLERVSEAISDQDECEAEAIISQALKGDKP